MGRADHFIDYDLVSSFYWSPFPDWVALATGIFTFVDQCSKSDYGRVVKVYDKTNLKLFSPLMYGSDEWKEVYKNRTSTERINNRILNDFGLHTLTCRNGSKHFFFAILAGINIHLDAWAKADHFS